MDSLCRAGLAGLARLAGSTGFSFGWIGWIDWIFNWNLDDVKMVRHVILTVEKHEHQQLDLLESGNAIHAIITS